MLLPLPLALLRAEHGDHPSRVAIIDTPRLVRRRCASVVVAVLTPLALVLGASAAEIRTRVSSTQTPRFVSTRAVTPTQDIGSCASDVVNLFVTLASLPGDVASEVVTHLSRDY